MKKLLSLILALSLTLSLAACGGKGEDKAKDEPNEKKEVKADKKELKGEDAARDAAENFFDAFCDFDFEEAEKYFDGEIPSDVKGAYSMALDEMLAGMPAEMSAYKSDFEDIFNDLIEKMKKSVSYKITDVEGDGDEYIVSVELTMPDMESVDFDSVMSSSMEEELMTLVMEYAESGKITESMSEDEMMEIIMPELIKIIKNAFNDMDFETTTDSGEITVAEIDGEWLVTEMD